MDKKPGLMRKLSRKLSAPPPIKQTLTSKYRQLMANPLLFEEMKKNGSLSQGEIEKLQGLIYKSINMEHFKIRQENQKISEQKPNFNRQKSINLPPKQPHLNKTIDVGHFKIRQENQKKSEQKPNFNRQKSINLPPKQPHLNKTIDVEHFKIRQENQKISEQKSNFNRQKSINLPPKQPHLNKTIDVEHFKIRQENQKKSGQKPHFNRQKSIPLPREQKPNFNRQKSINLPPKQPHLNKTIDVEHFKIRQENQKKSEQKPNFNREKCINLPPRQPHLNKTINEKKHVAKVEKRQQIPEKRRSLSAQHFDRKKGKKINSNPTVCYKILNKSQSMDDIAEMSMELKKPTPLRRRILTSDRFVTPRTEKRQELQEKLENWLEKRGKSLRDFHHLKCFGVHGFDDDKENVEIVRIDNSYSDLEMATGESINLDKIANQALYDLYSLIIEGYPVDKCELWLELMREKCPNITKEPQYWECRAAVEQSRGDVTSAVECYKSAIIQGAEVSKVDDSLDKLLEKFNLMKISNAGEDRVKILKDARNIFKSSIIQFAVQERRNQTKNSTIIDEKKFIATPVRRSTRKSRSMYVSTPGVRIYSSLQTVESPIRDKLKFQTNQTLIR